MTQGSAARRRYRQDSHGSIANLRGPSGVRYPGHNSTLGWAIYMLCFYCRLGRLSQKREQGDKMRRCKVPFQFPLAPQYFCRNNTPLVRNFTTTQKTKHCASPRCLKKKKKTRKHKFCFHGSHYSNLCTKGHIMCAHCMNGAMQIPADLQATSWDALSLTSEICKALKLAVIYRHGPMLRKNKVTDSGCCDKGGKPSIM